VTLSDGSVPAGPVPPSGETPPPPPSLLSLSDVRLASRLLTRSPFYIDEGVFLRIYQNSIASFETTRVAWRLTQPDGRTVVNSLDVTTPFTTPAGVNRVDVHPGEGLLFNVTCFSTSPSIGGPMVPERGQTYIMVQLVNGSGATATVIATLVGNYIAGGQAIGWPGSPVVDSFAGAGYPDQRGGLAPAPGTELSFVFGAGLRSRLQTAYCKLTTSAAAGNRLVRVVHQVSGVSVGVFPAPAVVGPSTLSEYTLVPGGSSQATSSSLGIDQVIGVPDTYVFQHDQLLATSTVGLAAGDQFSGWNFLFESWVEVPN
jgi:hypothetical protein